MTKADVGKWFEAECSHQIKQKVCINCSIKSLKEERKRTAKQIFKELRRKDIHKNSPIKVRTTGNEELIAFKRKDFDKIEAKRCGGKE